MKWIYSLILLGITLLMGLSFLLNYKNEMSDVKRIAEQEAVTSYDKDILYRRWVSMHGGVYVAVNEKTLPNPYLKFVKDRDVIIDPSKTLTLINPAYMTRQVFDLANAYNGVKGHITSLNPIRAANKADNWETNVLKMFENGVAEYSSIEIIDSTEYLRYMRPMIVEKNCLLCHQQQGYKEGQIRGGISIAVPMNRYYQLAYARLWQDFYMYLAVLLVYAVLSFFVFKRLMKEYCKRLKFQQDVLDREAVLIAQNEEYVKLNAQLEISKAKAEESDRLKSAFLVNISHEIRTPMNGILGFAELLKEPHFTGEEQKEFIEIIESSGERLLNIISDLIDISKVDSGEARVVLSEVDVNNQMEFIRGFYAEDVEKRDLKLVLRKVLLEKYAKVSTDREKVFSVLMNLIKNAVKFSKEGGFIEFGCEKKEDNLVFFVKDNGIGIPKDKLNCIFDRFVQADQSLNRSYEGAGLGLAISKGYVEILGGKIWVESEIDKGSQFYFTIPYIAIETPEIVNVESEIQKSLHNPKIKVLIVDDDLVGMKYLSFLMGEYDSEIIQTNNGTDAISICRNNPNIDLILMDIRMPNIDGYEATRQIRQFNKDVVIIAQTANALKGDKDKSIAAGCNDYITKPIDKRVLDSKIRMYFDCLNVE